MFSHQTDLPLSLLSTALLPVTGASARKGFPEMQHQIAAFLPQMLSETQLTLSFYWLEQLSLIKFLGE